MTNITQEESRIALLGLIATESEKVDACPSAMKRLLPSWREN
jgi:hypothetical protein